MDALKEIAGWVLGGLSLIGVIAWFTRRDVSRYDIGLTRIAALEQSCVTHDDLERAMSRLAADRERMHGENKADLEKLFHTLETYESRRSRTEHGIRDDVQVLMIQIAVLAQAQGINLPTPRGRRDEPLP
jgi:hypothetical protein